MTLNFTGGGACTVTATQAGNLYYLAATPVAQSFTVVATQAAAPTFSYRTPQTLQAPIQLGISDTAPGAMIYYTVDGSTPATDGSNPATQMAASPVEVPVTALGATQINAIALSPFNLVSPIATANYTLLPLGYQLMVPTTQVGQPSGFTANIYLNAGQSLQSLSTANSAGTTPEFTASEFVNCSIGWAGNQICPVSVVFNPQYPGLEGKRRWLSAPSPAPNLGPRPRTSR